MPATNEAVTPEAPISTVETSPRGIESILLVEDEDIVRTLVRRVLLSLGYAVVETADPLEALALCAGERAFDLLVTDVVMPGMNGNELAAQLVARFPDLKVLFTSGYASNTGVIDGELTPGTAFLQKPFALSEFAAKVRELLDAPGVDAPLRKIA